MLLCFQSLKDPVVSVAAGLRHSLAVTGKLAPKHHQCFSLSSQSTHPNVLFNPQSQAVYISGELASAVTLREHSAPGLSPPTSALRCPLWYQVSGLLNRNS